MKKTTTGHARSTATDRFGAQYFDHFYRDAATRVVSRVQMRDRAVLIGALLRQIELPVRRILDVGCGLGLLRGGFAAVLPRARYTGLEFSDYLCRRYGWIHGSVTDYQPTKPYDLVVCYDVLQYLDDADAARALKNFSRLTRCALYLSALTRRDWRENCDRSRTDRDVHLRTGEWYRRRLERRFHYVGCGVWVRRDVGLVQWEMESARL